MSAPMTVTDVLQQRAGKRRTPAEQSARAQLLAARMGLSAALNKEMRARNLVERARRVVDEAEAAELAAMRAAAEGGAQ